MAQNIFLAFSNSVGTTDYEKLWLYVFSLQVDCGFNKWDTCVLFPHILNFWGLHTLP